MNSFVEFWKIGFGIQKYTRKNQIEYIYSNL